VGLAHHVRRNGHKTTIARTERFVSVRMYHGLGEIVRGFTKNIFAVFGRSYVLAAGFGIGTLVFHFCPFVLALTGNRLAIVAVAMILTTRLIFFGALRYPLWSALLMHPLLVLIWTWILLRSIWIVGIRRQLSWRGRVYDPEQTRFGAGR
jgi:predicted membrane-bound spermidine synthase